MRESRQKSILTQQARRRFQMPLDASQKEMCLLCGYSSFRAFQKELEERWLQGRGEVYLALLGNEVEH